jgi:hypothetical protein
VVVSTAVMDKGSQQTKVKATEVKTKKVRSTSHKIVEDAQCNSSCPTCEACKISITEDIKALQCDRCAGKRAWKCIECIGISEDVYAVLMTDSVSSLRWFCEQCDEAILKSKPRISTVAVKDNEACINNNKIDEILRMLEQLLEKADVTERRLDRIEKEIQTKADVSVVAQIEQRIKKVEEILGEDHGARLQKPDSWADIVAKEVDVRLKGVVDEVSSLQEHTRVLQKDKEEQEEIYKRKQSVVIHGLEESSSVDNDNRKKFDEDIITDLLHQIKCDEVSVNVAIRLGKQKDGSDAKPRPVKMVLQSEAQKDRVLHSAKNLKGLSNGMEKVFIHQDLTPKQRESRHQLVIELQRRKAQGEQNLIIVGEKIVTRRPRS